VIAFWDAKKSANKVSAPERVTSPMISNSMSYTSKGRWTVHCDEANKPTREQIVL